MKKIYLVNSKGEKELFSFHKVYRSSKRVGASDVLAKKIAHEIEKRIYPGMKTEEIFKLVKSFLKESPASAIKFSLKQAMSSYEIDFLAKNNELTYLGECKYHTFSGARVDLKVALYNYARFLDILNSSRFKSSSTKAIIVTNTKFTTEAIKYCKCMNVDLLGWKYPKNQGLECLIEKNKLYPVTILPSFKAHFKSVFARNKMMLVLDLLNVPLNQLVKKLKLSSRELEQLVREAKILLE
jgi:hypothetical protein